jgi:hypothetical protein
VIERLFLREMKHQAGRIAEIDVAAAIGAEAAVLDRTAISERVRAGVDPFGTPGRRVA